MQNIIQGTQKTILLRIGTETNGVMGDPVDFTGVSTITTCFKNADGTDLDLGLGTGITVIGNPVLGKISIFITAAQSALLATTSGAVLQVSWSYGSGDPFAIQIPDGYAVLESEC